MVCDNHFHSSSSQQDFQQLVQQYKFTIEAIFDDQEARALFRTFLKKDLNEEPFLFYEAVEKYNKTRLDKNRLELASEIIDKFMVVGAQHELNLSTSLRNDILKSWKQIYENNKDVKDSDLISCPKDLFTKAQDVIFIELKQDNFPRFVNSETFKKHVQKEHKKDSSILDKLGKKKNMNRSSSDVSTSFDDNHSVSSSSLVSTPSSESRQSMDASSESDSLDEKIENHVITLDNIDIALGLKRSSSTSSVSSLSLSNIHSGYVPPKEGELIPLLDELSPYVTPKDHQLALNLYDSFLNFPNEWTTLDDKVGMRTASSKPVYSFNPQKNPSESRPRFMLAISGIVPGTPKEWINLMYTEKVKTKICKRFSERFQVEYKSIDEQQGIHYPNSIIYMEFPLPFPITNRDFVVAKTIIPDKYDPATGEYGRYIMIQKPSYHHEFAPSKSRIRANHTVIYIVEKKGNASVRYTCLETGDMLGNIPAKLTAQLYRSTAKVMHNKVRKVCSSAYESHVLKQTTVHDHDGGLATLAEYQDYYKM